MECLKNEVDILHKVDHPHIAKYFETYDEPNYIYMVMELLPGGELYDKIIDNDTPFTEKEASQIVYKCIKALNHCHDLNIIHRDLKPENIVFDADQEPKIIDFGLAIDQT
jgi:calcium-dependent protein kinase